MQGCPSILVVDDSLTQLAFLEDVLEKEGYTVVTAQNGIEAISRVYEAPPALILSDVMMPELNGYHLCRLLKNDPSTSRIPIILLTNLRERHDRFWGEHAGADLFLEKTGDLAPIIQAVAKLMPQSADDLPDPPAHRPSTGGLDRHDIQARINGILDRLLYESTISNEVLKLTGLAHDTKQLAGELLRFLSNISRYSVAGLVLNDGRDNFLLCLQITEPVSRDFVDRARRETMEAAGLDPGKNHHRTMVIGEPSESPPSASSFYHLHTLPIRDDGILLASLALFDTGKTRLTEGARQGLNTVAERLLVVMRYLKKFKEIEEVKADFVSMLVHDLRTPLTSIKGFADVLSEEILGPVNPEQADALGNIHSGCYQMLTLIEDILDISKLEAGKMQLHPSPVQTRSLAQRTIRNLESLFQEKSLEVRLDIPEDAPSVLADSRQLSRVFTNLLTNAAKFCSEKDRIFLEAEVLDGGLKIDVIDTGPGIPPEQLEKLFGRYQQLHSTAMFRKGTGLGLAICKEIVSLHGGEIWAKSPVFENGGSRFSFTVPLA